GGITTRCQGAGTTAYTTSATNASSYQWAISPTSAGTISGTGTTGTVTWNSGFSGTATIYAAAISCDGSPTASSSRTMVVTPLASVPTLPSPVSGGTTRCQGGGSTEYSTSSSNAVSYQWSIEPSAAGIISGTGST